MANVRKVLITGSNGFIGSHLVKHAIDLGYEVWAGVRKGCDLSLIHDWNIKIVELQLNDRKYLINWFSNHYELKEQFSLIIHCAAVTVAYNDRHYFDINIGLLKNLIVALEETQYTGKFVFMSTLAAMGPQTDFNRKISIDDIPRPISPYGKSKLEAEKLLAKSRLAYFIAAPTAVFGPGDKDFLQIFRSIQSGLEVLLAVKNQQISLIYVKDLAKVILALADKPLLKRKYLISDGKAYTSVQFHGIIGKIMNKQTIKLFFAPLLAILVGYLFSWISKIFQFKNLLNPDKLKELAAKNWVVELDSLEEDSGIKEFTSLETAVTETVRWYKEKGWI